jgi:predicted DNA-binding transcriptional regulator YafY
MSEPWVKVEELAEHLSVAKDTIYKWIASHRAIFLPIVLAAYGSLKFQKLMNGFEQVKQLI